MNKQEIETYNRLCAEFLEWEKCDTVYRTVEYYNNEKVVGNATHPSHMKFHSNWNLIMEVVEAIEKLFDHPNKEINVDIKAGQLEIFQRPYRLEGNDYHKVIYLGNGYINNSKKKKQ